MAADTSYSRLDPAPMRPYKRQRLADKKPVRPWEHIDTGARSDLKITHWGRPTEVPRSFKQYNVQVIVPEFDDEIYEKHLTDEKWTQDETQYLLNLYKDSAGKWPVIIDRYDRGERNMEELKARFYQVTAAMMQVATPISSMTKPEYDHYEMLTKFNPSQETSRKRLAEGHLQRHKNEVDEETVLLGELQRIMANQIVLDAEREDLRERLDYPHANSNSYQYTTSQALTTLWQQLVAADRLRKGGRMLNKGPHSAILDSAAPTSAVSTSARQRDSNVGLPETPTSNVRLSEKEALRFGVHHAGPGEKLPSGVTFASDRLSKPRVAKSTLQTDKIAEVLRAIGVPDLIPLPTSPVIEAFDQIMTKLHMLLDMRKLAEKEEQELKIREAEAARVAA